MKNKRIIRAIILMVLVVAYFVADSKLYYYGRSNFNIMRYSLPLGVEPEYWDSHYCWPMRGFTLERDSDLLLQKYDSIKVDDDTIIVASIDKYGIGKDRLFVFVTDEKGDCYSVHISGEDDLITDISHISSTDKKDDDGIYRWFSFEDDKNTMGKLMSFRIGCVLFAICYFSIVGIFSVFMRKSKERSRMK